MCRRWFVAFVLTVSTSFSSESSAQTSVRRSATTTSTRTAERCRACGSPELLGRLEALVLSRDDELTALIVRSLGETGTPLALPVLRASFLEPVPEIRVAAIQAMSQLGFVESVPLYTKALEDPDASVAAAGATALGQHPLRAVRAALFAAAASKKTAASTKGAAIRALLAHDTWEARRDAELLLNADAQLRAQMNAVVAEHPKPCKTCFEPRLTKALSDLVAGDAAQRIDALDAVTDLRPRVRPLGLADAMTNDDEAKVRMAAIDVVSASTTALAKDMLVEYTFEGHPSDVQVRAVRLIASSSHTPAIDRIEAIILGSDSKLGSVALGSLTKPGANERHVEASRIVATTATATSGLRQLALTVMAENTHPAAPDLLYEYAFAEDAGLARTSLALLRRHYPDVYARAERNLPSSTANAVFLISSGAFGATGFGLLGSIRDGDAVAPLLSTAGGFALGLGTGYLLTLDEDLYAGPVGVYTTGGVWGLAAGLGTGMIVAGENGSSAPIQIGGALGVATGAFAGSLALGDRDWSTGDVAFVNVSALQAMATTTGLLLVPAQDGDAVKAAGGVLAAGAVLGTVPALAFSRRIDLSGPRVAFVGATSATGAWVGAWAPRLFTDRELAQRTAGGALLGEGVGYLSGVLVSQYADIDNTTTQRLVLGSSLGAFIGGGAGLMAVDVGIEGGAGLVEAGTLAGTTLALTLYADDPDYDLVGLGVSLGAWFGGWTPGLYGELGRDTMGREATGGVMLGAASGALLTLTAFDDGDVHGQQKLFAPIGTASGASLGAGLWLLQRDADDQNVIRAMQTAALLGFAGGTFGLSQIDVDAGDRNAAIVATGYGALAGVLLPSLWTDDPTGRQHAGGALTLAPALGIGTLLASPYLDLTPEDAVELGLYGLAGASVGDGMLRLAEASPRARAVTTLGVSAAGLGLGYLVAPTTEIRGEDAAGMAGITAWGAMAGAGLPYLRRDESPTAEDVAAGIELGAGLGFATAAVLEQTLEPEPADVGEADVFALGGGALGLGLGLMIPDAKAPVVAGLFEVGTLTLGTTALYLAPRTEYDGLSVASTGLLTGYGAWLGAWAPTLYNDGEVPAKQRAGGALFGAGLGLASGALLTQAADIRPQTAEDLTETALGSLASTMTGAGIGLMIADDDDRLVVGLMEAVGVAGTAGVAVLAPSTEFSEGDYTLGALWTGQLLWNGLGAAYLADASDRQKAGVALTMAGVGGIGGGFVSQYVDREPTDVLLSFTGSVWGTWLGFFGSRLAEDAGVDLTNDDVLLSTLIGSDAGLLITTIALSPLVEMNPERVGWINLGGLSGALVGATFGLVAGGVDGANPGNVIGSGVGLLATSVVTGFVDFETSEDAVAQVAPEPTASERTRRGTWTALLPDVEDVRVGTTVMPPPPAGGEAPVILSISGRLR